MSCRFYSTAAKLPKSTHTITKLGYSHHQGAVATTHVQERSELKTAPALSWLHLVDALRLLHRNTTFSMTLYGHYLSNSEKLTDRSKIMHVLRLVLFVFFYKCILVSNHTVFAGAREILLQRFLQHYFWLYHSIQSYIPWSLSMCLTFSRHASFQSRFLLQRQSHLKPSAPTCHLGWYILTRNRLKLLVKTRNLCRFCSAGCLQYLDLWRKHLSSKFIQILSHCSVSLSPFFYRTFLFFNSSL